MDAITVRVDDPAQLAAVAKMAADQGKAPAAFMQDFLTGSVAVWRDQLALDRVTASEFVLRFTRDEFAAISAAADADAALGGFLARLKAEPYVWLGSAEVRQGVAYVVAGGFLTAERAAAILGY